MNKSKKIFVVVVIIFLLLMAWFAYDVSQKTTAPWNKGKVERETNAN